MGLAVCSKPTLMGRLARSPASAAETGLDSSWQELGFKLNEISPRARELLHLHRADINAETDLDVFATPEDRQVIGQQLPSLLQPSARQHNLPGGGAPRPSRILKLRFL